MVLLRRISFFLLCVVVFAQQPLIRGIGIYGNEQITDWAIERLMETQETKFYSFFVGGRQRLNKRVLEQDVTRIRDYYIQEGFLDIGVTANIVIREKGKMALVHIDIVEGQRYYFKRFSIGGDGSSYFSKLGKKFSLEFGQPFNHGLVESDRRLILKEAQNRGHPYVQVHSSWEKLDGDSIEVRFHVTLGKKARFGNIVYKNLEFTKKDFLDKEIKIRRGLPYNVDAINRSRESLYRTGLFNVVRLKEDTTKFQPDTLDMDVYIFEKKPRWFAIKIGLITDPDFDMTSDLTLEWGHRNLMGRGIGISARFVPSFQMISKWNNVSNRVEADISLPYVSKVKVPITLSLYYDPKNSKLTDVYDIWLVGGRVSGKYTKHNRILHQLSFSYDHVQVRGGFDSVSFEDISIERKITYTIERDSRDNFLFPSDGTVFRGANEFAGTFLGGDEHYNKSEAIS